MRGEELFTLEAAAYVFLQEACRGRLAAEAPCGSCSGARWTLASFSSSL